MFRDKKEETVLFSQNKMKTVPARLVFNGATEAYVKARKFSSSQTKTGKARQDDTAMKVYQITASENNDDRGVANNSLSILRRRRSFGAKRRRGYKGKRQARLEEFGFRFSRRISQQLMRSPKTPATMNTDNVSVYFPHGGKPSHSLVNMGVCSSGRLHQEQEQPARKGETSGSNHDLITDSDIQHASLLSPLLRWTVDDPHENMDQHCIGKQRAVGGLLRCHDDQDDATQYQDHYLQDVTNRSTSSSLPLPNMFLPIRTPTCATVDYMSASRNSNQQHKLSQPGLQLTSAPDFLPETNVLEGSLGYSVPVHRSRHHSLSASAGRKTNSRTRTIETPDELLCELQDAFAEVDIEV